MPLLNNLNQRFACKAMTGNSITDEQRFQILEAIRLTPTSLGLQAYDIVVITDQAMKDKIAPAIRNQPQIKNSDCVIVFAAQMKYDQSKVDNYINLISKTRNQPISELEPFKKSIEGSVSVLSDEEFLDWTMKQTYIALGFGLVACAELGVDSTPMEGFFREQVDEILGLNAQNLTASVILTVGQCDTEKDYLYGQKKVRREMDDFASII